MAKARLKVIPFRGKWTIRGLKNPQTGKRHRPPFNSKDEAETEKKKIEALEARGLQYIPAASNETIGEMLDLWVQKKERAGEKQASLSRIKNQVKQLKDPRLGLASRPVNDLHLYRAEFVRESLDAQQAAKHLSNQTMDHRLSYIRLACKFAIQRGPLSAPNPIDAYGITAPHNVDPKKHRAMTLEEIDALACAAFEPPVDREHRLAARVRLLMFLLGPFAGIRTQELGALFWECIDLDGRMILIRRVVRETKDGHAIVDDTKTGEEGKRDIPMNGILHAYLSSHKVWMRHEGYKTEGKAPVLVTLRAKEFIRPSAIQGETGHWHRLMKKAGLYKLENELTFYSGRHTAASMWGAIGLDPNEIADVLGHTRLDTARNFYRHPAPEFRQLKREIDALIGVGLHPVDDLIEALGFVFADRWRKKFAERWRELGLDINIECSPPPRPVTPLPRIGYDLHNAASDPKTLELTAVPTPTSEQQTTTTARLEDIRFKTPEELRRLRIAYANELKLQGKTKKQIASLLGTSDNVIANLWRTDENAHWLRKASEAERAAKREELRKAREEHPNATAEQLGRMVKLTPQKVTLWERQRGNPMPHQPGAHKVGKYRTEIVRWANEGISALEMQKRLRRAHGPKAPGTAHSSITLFMKREGITIRSKRDIAQYEPQIRDLISRGLSRERVARELAKVQGLSRSGILGFIRRHDLWRQAPDSEETPAAQ